MEEKLDPKLKYEKLRKKYAALKQQFGDLKIKMEKCENEYKILNDSHIELENKYNDCLTVLDASQYKKAVLEREIEEIMCQLDQCKQQPDLKCIKQNNSMNKAGTGILTGLLPVNGVIKNFQRNEKLEERILLLQEELDSKISENEQLHIKEFDLKKKYKLEIDELTNTNKELEKRLEKTIKECQEMKLKSSSEHSQIEEFKQRSKQSDDIIMDLKHKLNTFKSESDIKYNELRELIPKFDIDKLKVEHMCWLNVCKINYYFNIAKISTLYLGFLEHTLPILNSWKDRTTCMKPLILGNDFFEKIKVNIIRRLNQAIKNIKATKTIFRSNISFEINVSQKRSPITENNSEFLVDSTAYDVINGSFIESFSLIFTALKLQVLSFKMMISENSEMRNLSETRDKRKLINDSLSLVNSLKQILIKVRNMISFSINVGKDPDIIYLDSLETPSLYFEFSKLIKLIYSKISVENYPEKKCYFVDILKQVLMGEFIFEDKRIEITDDIQNSIMKIKELEKTRKTLHSQINNRIQHWLTKFCDILLKINKNISEIPDSESLFVVNTIDKETSSSTSITDKVDGLLNYVKENIPSNKILLSDLYQHPSKVFFMGSNLGEIQIVMRETKNKLLNAPPRITLPELHILNKRIEQLEESRNQQVKVINNLKRRLDFSNQVPPESDIQDNLVSTASVDVDENANSMIRKQSNSKDVGNNKLINTSQIDVHGISESLLREANLTLEYTVKGLQSKINELNDDITVTRKSYDEQISLLSQHICSLSEKLSQTDASTTSSYNQEILCYSCETWNTLDSIMKKTKGGCEKCRTKLLRPK